MAPFTRAIHIRKRALNLSREVSAFAGLAVQETVFVNLYGAWGDHFSSITDIACLFLTHGSLWRHFAATGLFKRCLLVEHVKILGGFGGRWEIM